ncbi:MAG TPA: DUF1294 domain-containing protein [Bacillota bacterium]|nr:DUF1294 domain-containing protein [Bacillota bacterium]
MHWSTNATYVLLLLNLWAFLLFGYDKLIAGGKKRRIPEKSLWLAALFGGAVGSLLAMKVFRHKTQHTNFVVGIPFLAVVQGVLLYIIVARGF